MNKIYLFLLALFASVGIASAAISKVEVKGSYNNGWSNSGFSLTKADTDGKVWTGSVEPYVNNGWEHQFAIYADGTALKASQKSYTSVPPLEINLSTSGSEEWFLIQNSGLKSQTLYFRLTFSSDTAAKLELAYTAFTGGTGSEGGDSGNTGSTSDGYYIKGAFSNDSWTPQPFSVNKTENGVTEYKATVKCGKANMSSWGDMVMYQVNGTETHTWYSNGNKLPVGQDYTSWKDNSEKGDIDASNLDPDYEYTFYFTPSTGKIYVAQGNKVYNTGNTGGTSDNGYYFTTDIDGWAHHPMTKESGGSANVGYIFQTSHPGEAWGKIAIYYEKDGVVHTYFSNGTPYNTDMTSYKPVEDDNAYGYIDVSALDPDYSYTFQFDTANKTLTITHYQQVWNNGNSGDGYYTASAGTNLELHLAGDITIWSDNKTRNSSYQDSLDKYNGYFVGENNNNTDYVYLQDDSDNPYLRFKSTDDLRDKWKFEYVGAGPEGVGGTGWYKLDLYERDARDLNNVRGRMWGQFKILSGGNINTNYGSTREGADYHNADNLAKLYTVFTEVKYGGGRNILLDNTAIDNCVIWFHPGKCDIYLEGTPHDMYVYYVNDTRTEAPAKTYLNTSSTQANNYPETDQFINGSDLYAWEHCIEGVTPGFEGADYYPYGKNAPAVHYEKVWRKKIPASIIYRTPMGYLTSVSMNDNTTYFARERLKADDVWFIESQINVFFRFENTDINNSSATKVYFNAWMDEYDAAGMKVGSKYLSRLFAPMDFYNGDDKSKEAAGIAPDKVKYNWYKFPGSLSTTFSNGAHAMFATNYGGFYPVGAENASADAAAAVALNGVDLYYVVGGSSDRVKLLYDRLNGTVAKTDEIAEIQINAEFYAQDHDIFRTGDLNTDLGEDIKYRFSVTDSEGHELLDEKNTAWTDLPFATWSANGEDGRHFNTGLYTVRCTVRKTVHDEVEVYSATEIYQVYPEHASAK